MKNGIQKGASLPKKKGPLEAIAECRERYKDDMSRILVLMCLGLGAALIIETRSGLDHFVGSFLIAAVILFIFYRDIKRYKPVYLKDYKLMLLLGLLVTGTLLLGRLSQYLFSGLHKGLNLPGADAYLFGLPIPVGAMLAALIFDFHTAMIFSFALSLLCGIWLNNPFYSIYAFVGSLTGAFSVMRCKKRSALIKGGLYVSLANVIATTIILLATGHLFSPTAGPAFIFAAMSGIIVSAVISVLLPLIEYFFGLSTDISLIELLDLDQPLMRNLMITAPGTYHHSVIAGSLAEAAAEAVGANPLLARVCAYYHDIGKIKMPEYFVENQTDRINKHERLAPSMSTMILTAHVKEGVDMARQYKLPQTVIDVIQQHHGTSLITYFYQKAVESSSDGPPAQEKYRYPGPRPQTRVAALVMMSDAVEAASRSLGDPTPARIAALVDRIINNIFLDGQIDECELTLKDLSEIKSRFIYILTSIFHRRIEYPEVEIKQMTHKVSSDVLSELNRGVAQHGNGTRDKEPSKADKDRQTEDRKAAQGDPDLFDPGR